MVFNLPFFHREEVLLLGRAGSLPLFSSVGLTAQQRTTHTYVIGITGQGKSKLLEHLLLQDIVAGRGCGLIDPHTDLADDLLCSLFANGYLSDLRRRGRIIYFDPMHSDWVMPFNVLKSAYPPYVTAMNLVEAFKRTWPESLREAPRFTNILLACLLVLIANERTLVDLPRLLTDKDWREEQLENITDEDLLSVFHERIDRWGKDEAVILESVLNKLSAFTLNPTLKRILGCQENHLDFRKIMDEGRVLIVDLGRCDGETRRLLGSLITIGIEQAALSRKTEDKRARTPFYFYIDEFQDFAANEGSDKTLATILSEARKFGLHLTLAHQTLGQISSERMPAALGNIGTKIVFAIDRLDAEIMAKKLFLVDGEQVKHEVVEKAQQERSHPVFYSLSEEWEKATQQIQNLKPRTCLVKRPQQQVTKLCTMTVADVPMPAEQLEKVKRSLMGGLVAVAPEREPRPKVTLELADFEPVASRPRVTRISMQAG